MRVIATIAAAALLAGASACTRSPAEPKPAPTAAASSAGDPAAVDPRADDLVRQMSKVLASAQALALEAEESWDQISDHFPRTQLTNRRHVAVKRPNRLVGDATGDAIDRSIWYNGRTLSVLDKAQNTYATLPMPSTIDEALDAVFERSGMVVPVGDFVFADPYARLMRSVQRGVYLGQRKVNGLTCHHLAFEQETIDWQLWIDAGDQPVPCKLVIAYKNEAAVPQYAVTFRKWNLKADVPDSLFEFVKPEGATRMELPAPPPAPKGGK